MLCLCVGHLIPGFLGCACTTITALYILLCDIRTDFWPQNGSNNKECYNQLSLVKGN